jgi:phosphodiesterase/alkaline phosphatase D-like protein
MKQLFQVLFVFYSTALFTTEGPQHANGIKIGEVTCDSAIVWARLTDGVAKFTTTAERDRVQLSRLPPPDLALKSKENSDSL